MTDDAGGRNRSELTRWVSGVDTVPTRNVAQESATVIPNQDTYHPGDVAQLLVVAPFAKASGLLSDLRQRHHADPGLRARERLGRRQGADRRHRHARGHRAGRSRRSGSEAARRRDEGSRPASTSGVRDRRASAAGAAGERDADRHGRRARPRDRTRRARHDRRVGEGARRLPGRATPTSRSSSSTKRCCR